MASSSQPQGQMAASKAAGETIEHVVIQHEPAMENVTDTDAEWHDARVDGLLEASDELPFVGVVVLEDETPVEIKAAQVALNGGRRGRFQFRRQQHERLLEASAAYLFAVYDPRDQKPIAKIVVPASIVDEELPSDNGWTTLNRESREATEEYCQRAWSRFFSPETVGETA